VTDHLIIIAYGDYGAPTIEHPPDVVHPGDTITISVRDYDPPPECYDETARDETARDEDGKIIAGSIHDDGDGAEYDEDDYCTINVEASMQEIIPPTGRDGPSHAGARPLLS